VTTCYRVHLKKAVTEDLNPIGSVAQPIGQRTLDLSVAKSKPSVTAK
jgi:hypothetical protein